MDDRPFNRLPDALLDFSQTADLFPFDIRNIYEHLAKGRWFDLPQGESEILHGNLDLLKQVYGNCPVQIDLVILNEPSKSTHRRFLDKRG